MGMNSGSEGGEGKRPGGQKTNEPAPGSKRTGATKAHYARQKGTAYAYFRVSTEDTSRLDKSQFTIYNFITNSFAFSPSRKELTLKLLEALKHRPKPFSALVDELRAPKGTLYLLCLSLERSGLIKKQPDGHYQLDTSFSKALREYADWWESWAGKEQFAPLQSLK